MHNLIYFCLPSFIILGLMFAIRRLRSSHDNLTGRAFNENSSELRALAEVNMPESILPYVLHLLSYHPDFPITAEVQDENDKKRLKNIMKNLRMIIDTLMNSLKDVSSNLSYLLKQVNMISQNYQDITDPNNIGLHFVTILATKILSEKIKVVENILAHPQDVFLPIELYEIRKNKLEGLNGVEQVFDKILKKNNPKSNNNKNNSIIKNKIFKNNVISPKLKVRNEKVEDNDNSDNDSENENNNNIKNNKNTKIIKNKNEKILKTNKSINKNILKEEPERVSSRLQKSGTRLSISYEEKEGSDDEVEGWEAAAAEISLSQSSRNSIENKKRNSNGELIKIYDSRNNNDNDSSNYEGKKKNKQNNDDDDDDDDDDNYDNDKASKRNSISLQRKNNRTQPSSLSSYITTSSATSSKAVVAQGEKSNLKSKRKYSDFQEELNSQSQSQSDSQGNVSTKENEEENGKEIENENEYECIENNENDENDSEEEEETDESEDLFREKRVRKQITVQVRAVKQTLKKVKKLIK